MTLKYKTEQEEFWAGDFGNKYISRNRKKEAVSSNIMMFSKILARTGPIQSAIEFGANIGQNLLAIRELLPKIELGAVEINPKASEELRLIEGLDVYEESILTFALPPERKYDLVYTRGVLIHISPEWLDTVYNKMLHCSKKYIMIAEYYNPTPIAVAYRGHEERLFKRDFAGEMLDSFNNLHLLDYGFIYRRDSFPQDDITWFLMEIQ